MPARLNISLNDGESTPVAHVFVPDGDVSPGHARFVNANASVPAASEYFFALVQRSTAKAEDYSTPGKKVAPSKVMFRLLYPSTYTDAVSGLTLVDFIDEHIFTSLCHPRSSTQRRKNGRVLMANCLNGTVTGQQVHDSFAGFY